MVRSNDVMRKAAMKELDLLREISSGDPDNKKHCVRLLGTFEHRNHVALVFESLQMNLRETLRKFGKHVGINIGAVRTYAKQLLIALRVRHSPLIHISSKNMSSKST
jgi:serine/threonine-protein kinase PRP4